MKNDTYRLGEALIRRKSRPSVAGPAVFALMLVLLAGPLGFRLDMPLVASVLLGILIFTFMLWRNAKRARSAAENLPKMEISVAPDALRFKDAGGIYEMPLSSIRSMAIHRRSGEPAALYLRHANGESIKIEGLERMDAFAAHLTRLLGAGKVSDIRWWQITD